MSRLLCHDNIRFLFMKLLSWYMLLMARQSNCDAASMLWRFIPVTQTYYRRGIEAATLPWYKTIMQWQQKNRFWTFCFRSIVAYDAAKYICRSLYATAKWFWWHDIKVVMITKCHGKKLYAATLGYCCRSIRAATRVQCRGIITLWHDGVLMCVLNTP